MTAADHSSVSLPQAHYQERLARIQQYLAEQGLDGLLLLNAANIMWAIGFFHIPNERPLGLYIAVRGEPILFAPFLEKENAEANGIASVQTYWEFPGKVPPEVWMLQQISGQRIGIDGVGHGRFLEMQAIKPRLCLDGSVTQLRYIKSAEELALIQQAANYADYGLEVAKEAVAERLHKGITEQEVVQEVQSETTTKMRRELDDLVNFYRGAVVLTAHTGARAALPHGQPGPIQIQPGDTLIVGIGAKVGGYLAESGCTFIIGEPKPDQMKCLEATWACDQAAVDALIPGNSCTSVNDAALAVLRDAGYGDYIRHRIGHGMGIEGHEPPWLSDGDETLLEPMMVFSNEPGIYRPGIDGYRIIDSMVVTAEGGQRLSRYLSEHGPDDRVISI
ncbi:MAG: Xaa-Pro peptidase family protein [Chloroflexota bacterium]